MIHHLAPRNQATEIVSLTFEANAGILGISIRGHVSDAIARAHEIADNVLGDTRWRIDSVEYNPPRWEDMADGGITKVVAARAPKGVNV